MTLGSPDSIKTENAHQTFWEDSLRSAIHCIPPLWPLDSFVAVNPFLGINHQSFFMASFWIRKILHGNIFMDPVYYLNQFQNKRVSESKFQKIQNRILKKEVSLDKYTGVFESFQSLEDYLRHGLENNNQNQVLSIADYIDLKENTQWNTWITDEISKWCSVYFDQGQSLWPMPWKEESLWNAWRKASIIDQNPEFLGLKEFRKRVQSLPDNPVNFIQESLQNLNIPQNHQIEYLQRILVSVSGWAAYLQYLNRQNNPVGLESNTLVHLLAIRMVFEGSLFQSIHNSDHYFQPWLEGLDGKIEETLAGKKDQYALYLSQCLLENFFQDQILNALKTPNTLITNSQVQKTVQAVFCIDVRSEIYRKVLESESNEIETLGFAGFFGISIEYFPFGNEKGVSLCPVLINPKIQVGQGLLKGNSQKNQKTLNSLKTKEIWLRAWNSFKSSAISCFSFVESVGLSFLGPMLQKSFPGFRLFSAAVKNPPFFKPIFRKSEVLEKYMAVNSIKGIILEDEIETAASSLKNMGLIHNFASLVLLAGHGSTSVNNPYSASLDCGACGGHAGDINARVLVSILNNPDTRKGLIQYGINIPEKTHFIAGLHNTTTDELSLYNLESVPEHLSLELEKLKSWVKSASLKARLKRHSLFPPLEPLIKDPDKIVMENSQDWAQVRPEWGLAGNAAFIAAPRSRTQNLDLKGRVFLHNYQENKDPDQSILELILLAPMVVATWINLQYYASTVNNEIYGSGNKTIHNMVGKLGIWQGNGGDLQTGLPLQSLHNGKEWVHEPLRLSVFLEASQQNLEKLILQDQELKNLILNHWIYIFSIDPKTGKIYRYLGLHNWEEE